MKVMIMTMMTSMLAVLLNASDNDEDYDYDEEDEDDDEEEDLHAR